MAQSLPTSSETVPGEALGVISNSSFIQLVNNAFKNYQSTLALSRSPLANSALITPTLVKDDVSPTAEERAHGLRLLLQWAVNQIAPGAIETPMGAYRPLDDPLWLNPHWWRYNILRHRYIEPLHPDDFIDGGRYTETLIALTGIPSTDTFFDERNRAIRDVTQRLRQQLIDGKAINELQRLALEKAILPIIDQEYPLKLMGIASIFTEVFPRTLLNQIASRESIPQISQHLEYLIQQRLLLVGDNNSNLWMSSALRNYIYQRHVERELQRWHAQAASFYATQSSLLNVVTHWRLAGQHSKAIEILLSSADELVKELYISELISALNQFEEHQVTASQWRELQILLSELYQKRSQREDALEACRRALKVTKKAADQARIYRRMGKLYEKYNQRHALTYYQQAVERLQIDAEELPYVLKDRGWLYILSSAWELAEQDLTKSLELAPQNERDLRADIFDAFAGLYRNQKENDLALQYAQDALAIREEMGNLLRIATSQNNLGLIYGAAADYQNSIAAYTEALETYEKLHDSENCVGMHLNIGAAYFKMGDIQEAINCYCRGLEICQQRKLPLAELKTHYNLAEAYAEIESVEMARQHWQLGYRLSLESSFTEQVNLFQALQTTFPFLNPQERQSNRATETNSDIKPIEAWEHEDRSIIELANKQQITPKLLINQLHISKATATRKLATLVAKGVLEKHGKGRGTYYTLPQHSAPVAATSSAKVRTSTALPKPIDLGWVRQKLDTEVPALSEQYAIKVIAIRTQNSQANPPLRLEAEFHTLPDLFTFFALEQQIAELLDIDVDLKPRQD